MASPELPNDPPTSAHPQLRLAFDLALWRQQEQVARARALDGKLGHAGGLGPVRAIGRRGYVKVSNREMLNALLYVVRQGCVWQALAHDLLCACPAEAGAACRSGSGRRWTARSSSGTSAAMGGAQQRAQAIGRSRGGWTTKLHVAAVDEYTPLILSQPPGQAGDRFIAVAAGAWHTRGRAARSSAGGRNSY